LSPAAIFELVGGSVYSDEQPTDNPSKSCPSEAGLGLPPVSIPMPSCRSVTRWAGFGPVRRIALSDVVYGDRWGQHHRD